MIYIQNKDVNFVCEYPDIFQCFYTKAIPYNPGIQNIFAIYDKEIERKFTPPPNKKIYK